MRVKATKLEVETRTSRLVTGQATVLARSIATTAEQLATSVSRYEFTATKLVEKTRDTFRDVADLLQIRARRSRAIIADTHTVHSRRTVLLSSEETTIDGKKILLG